MFLSDFYIQSTMLGMWGTPKAEWKCVLLPENLETNRRHKTNKLKTKFQDGKWQEPSEI